jgi:aldehyde dehydrogenase family protein
MSQAPTLTADGAGASATAEFDLINPAADRPFSAAPDASLDQLDAALPAAERAFGAWGTDEQPRRAALRHAAEELRSRELAGLIGLAPEPRGERSPRWCAISMVRVLDPFGIKELGQSGMVAVGRGGRSITDRAPLVTIDPGGCACKRTRPSVMVMSGMTRKPCRPFGQR